MSSSFTQKKINSGKASEKCVSNFYFIISNPVNSTVLHRAKTVKVIQSGMSQAAPVLSINRDHSSQHVSLLQCILNGHRGKRWLKVSSLAKILSQHLKTIVAPALQVIHTTLVSSFIHNIYII